MASLQEIKGRINSIKDTQKITNAMYLISYTKLRRARMEWERTKPYFDQLRGEMHQLLASDAELTHPAILKDGAAEPDGTWGCLVITADRGLAGAYNLNVIKETQKLLDAHPNTRLFILGSYGQHYFQNRGAAVETTGVSLNTNPRLSDARNLAAQLLDPFMKGELTQLYLIYTDMKNRLSMEAVTERLLPIRQEQLPEPESGESQTEYECYPGAAAVLEAILPSFAVGYLYSALVDSYCCEQNSRMTAMNAANDNAEEMLHALSIQFNRVRQTNITQEITEVSSGARAQKRKREQEETA